MNCSLRVGLCQAFETFRCCPLPTHHLPHAAPLSSDIQNCGLDCLADDAFDFVGASNVTTVNIQMNAFVELPEQLLWGMNSMLYFFARDLKKLIGLPGKFFLDQPQVVVIFFTGSATLGLQGLPDELLRGLTGLVYFSLDGCGFTNLPNMDDLTVRMSGVFGKPFCKPLRPCEQTSFMCFSFNICSVRSSTLFNSFSSSFF